MAQQSQYNWLDFAKPTLPYISYTSPVNEAPHFVSGSQNVLASQIGYLEKRPGFSTAVESTLSTVPGIITRIFGWRRWNGSFFVMLSTRVSGVSKVYKLERGVDLSFTLIWTSTSATSFDFVVSDNFCFFGNGTDMRKFDGTTVSKWGTDAPATAPAISLLSGTLPLGMTAVGSLISGTPTVLGTSQITVTVTDAAATTVSKTFNFNVVPNTLRIDNGSSTLPHLTKGSATTINFVATAGTLPYTWSLFSGALPTGMTLNSTTGIVSGTPTVAGPFGFAIKVTDAAANTFVQAFNVYVQDPGTLSIGPASPLAAATVGIPYTATLTAAGGTGTYTISFLPGTIVSTPFDTLPQGLAVNQSGAALNFTGTAVTAGTYALQILVTDSGGNSLISDYALPVAISQLNIDTLTLPTAYLGVPYSFNISVEGGTPPYTYAYTAGTLNAQTGYVYGYTYTTVYGHESNMSPLSESTGIFTARDPSALLIASGDPQVNGINLYRTTDGGAADPAEMRLVVSLTNTNQSFLDSTQDVDLGLQTGPGFLINTPPTPTIGFVWSNGRIYGFVNNTSYYSGAEEVSNGIQEECWPSGADGNFYAWPSQVGGQAVTQNGVDIGLSEQFWQVSGDTLDTFRKSLLLDKAGVGSPTCISAVGNSVQWVDSAKQIWSSSLGEFGEPIRTDLTALDPLQTFIGYHKSRNYNWIYVLDAANSKLFIYDLDLDQWNTPWTVAASAIWSGEIAVGEIALLVAISGQVFFLTPGTFLDGFIPYEDDLKFNLLPVSPGRLTTGRSRITPVQLEGIAFETNLPDGTPPNPSFVGQLSDDDPVLTDQPKWTDVTDFFVTPQYQPQGENIYVQEYRCDSTTNPAIRSATWIKFPMGILAWKIYSFTLSWIKA